MKTILVDAIQCLILEDGSLLDSMYALLKSYPNDKIILTSANDEQLKHFRLDQAPYEVFTLKHNPEKTDPQYFMTLLKKYDLTIDEVVYIEHDAAVVKAAESTGILTFLYDHTEKSMEGLKQFLDNNL